MASFAKAVKTGRQTHRERSQPRKRKHLGLLEKGKDWKLRRTDYHGKETRIKALMQKAAARNPDEFYFGMVNTQTKNGVHTKTRDTTAVFTAEELKVMRSQDLDYMNMRMKQEQEKIARLQAELHLLDGKAENKHTVFVDSKQQVAEFDAAEYFETAPELVHRTFNRPSLKTLREKAVAAPDAHQLKKLEKQRKLNYMELEHRTKRLEQIRKMVHELQTQKDLMGKGKRTKVVREDKTVAYKWRQERKR